MQPTDNPVDESTSGPEVIIKQVVEVQPAEVIVPETEIPQITIDPAPPAEDLPPMPEEPKVESPAPPENEIVVEPTSIPEPNIEQSIVIEPAAPVIESEAVPTVPVTPTSQETPSHLTENQIKRDAPLVDIPPPLAPVLPSTPPLAPAKHDAKYTKDVPRKVLELSDEEINAARLLWSREHIAEARSKSNTNRKDRMNKMLDMIEATVKNKPQTTTHIVANSMKISEKTASGYLQKLVKSGRIRASGNSRNRLYY
jgi:predicted transcriptional regulator